jgi:hypothetical protein
MLITVRSLACLGLHATVIDTVGTEAHHVVPDRNRCTAESRCPNRDIHRRFDLSPRLTEVLQMAVSVLALTRRNRPEGIKTASDSRSGVRIESVGAALIARRVVHLPSLRAPMNDEELLTTSQAAEALSASSQTIRN